MSGDFRFDTLKCLYGATPGWVDLTPMIQACMNAEGNSHKYYIDMLVEMQKRSFISLNDYELVRFDQPYNGAYADFPLRAKIKPDGIDEYRRVKIEKSDTKNLPWKLIIPWVLATLAILTLLFNLAGKYHWFGL